MQSNSPTNLPRLRKYPTPSSQLEKKSTQRELQHPISYLNRIPKQLKQVYKLIRQKKGNTGKRPQLTSDQVVDYSNGGAADTRTKLAAEWGASARSVARSTTCAAYAQLITQEIMMRIVTRHLLQIPSDYGGGVPNFDEAKRHATISVQFANGAEHRGRHGLAHFSR